MLGAFLIVLNFTIAISAVALFFYTFPFRKWPMVRYLYLANIGFLIKAFCMTEVLITQSFDEKVFYSRFRIVGMALLAPSYLLFASHLTKRMRWLQTRTANVIMFLPGVITIGLTLVPEWRDYVVTDFHPFHYADLSVLTFSNGPWFFWEAGSSYLQALLILSICVWSAFSERGRVRYQVILILIISLSTLSLDLISHFTQSPLRWAMVTSSLYGLNQFVLAYGATFLGLANVRALAKQKIFDHIPYPMFAVDSSGRVASANKAANDTFGIGDKQIAAPIETLLDEGKRKPGEVKIKKSDGTDVYFALSVVPLEAGEGVDVGQLYSYKEITNEKKVEQELVSLLSVLSHDLAGTIHHQARLADVVAQKLPDGEKELAAALVESSAANRDLIHGLVLWSKSQSDELRKQHRPFEINALIEDTIEITRPLWSAKRIKLSSERGPQTIVLGNSGMISSVLRNFISNATRASDPDSSIVITIEPKDSSVTVAVVDRGHGLKRDTRQEPLRNGSGGYGIGLVLGRRFIDQHGGALSVEENPEGGTRAWFSLPKT